MTARPIVVRIAELAVAGPPSRLAAHGLGSCVAVTLHDPIARIGGLAHVLLPAPGARRDPRPARCATTAVPALIERMVTAGADPARLVARLAGGATLFAGPGGGGPESLGSRNVTAVRAALAAGGIRVSAEWTGGDFGRSVTFDPDSGRIDVSSVRHGSRAL